MKCVNDFECLSNDGTNHQQAILISPIDRNICEERKKYFDWKNKNSFVYQDYINYSISTYNIYKLNNKKEIKNQMIFDINNNIEGGEEYVTNYKLDFLRCSLDNQVARCNMNRTRESSNRNLIRHKGSMKHSRSSTIDRLKILDKDAYKYYKNRKLLLLEIKNNRKLRPLLTNTLNKNFFIDIYDNKFYQKKSRYFYNQN